MKMGKFEIPYNLKKCNLRFIDVLLIFVYLLQGHNKTYCKIIVVKQNKTLINKSRLKYYQLN